MVYVNNAFDVSERLACRHVGLLPFAPFKADTFDDPGRALRAWARAYAGRSALWECRRAYVDLRNDGWQVDPKTIQQLWAQKALRVILKLRRRRLGVLTVPAVGAEIAGDVW